MPKNIKSKNMGARSGVKNTTGSKTSKKSALNALNKAGSPADHTNSMRKLDKMFGAQAGVFESAESMKKTKDPSTGKKINFGKAAGIPDFKKGGY